MRTLTEEELNTPLREVIAKLRADGESVLFREDGMAVAAILTADAFRLWGEQLDKEFWAMIDEVRADNAHLDPDEIYAEVERMVQEVREEQRALRAAS